MPRFCHLAIRALTFLVAVIFFSLAVSTPASAQYTDRQAIDDLGGPKTFAARRAELAKQAKTGFVLLFARNDVPEAGHYREDNDFYYFTGLQDPGAVMLLDAAKNVTYIFEPQQLPRTVRIYGANLLSMPETDRAALGFPNVLPLGNLDIMISSAMVRFSGDSPNTDLWLRLGFPDKADGARLETGLDHAMKFDHPYHEPIPADLAPNYLLAERYPMLHQRDVTSIIDNMRNIKQPEEIEVLRRIGKISAEGNADAIAHAKPGMFQYQIEARAYYYMFDRGAQGASYPAIVSSGKDINTIHYFFDRDKIEANELVVLDFAGSLDHMCMDITRTFNVSGKFTPEQAKWYAVDLEAQKATIALLVPGHTYEEAAAAGKSVFEKAGIGDQFTGFPGHFVGLATHDVMRVAGPVKPGQVVTVEPFIDFPDKRMHYRVEDTLLITNGGPENLSAAIPKEMKDVENLVGSAK